MLYIYMYFCFPFWHKAMAISRIHLICLLCILVDKILRIKVHLRSPEPSFYYYNFALTGPIGKIQAPICFSSNAAAIGVQKALLQFLYLVAVLEMAYF